MRKRFCTKCQGLLTGRRGHGFVTMNGAGILCAGCNSPGGSRKKSLAAEMKSEVGYGR